MSLLDKLLGGAWRNTVVDGSNPPITITVPNENIGGPYPARTWFRGSLNCTTTQHFGEDRVNMRRKAEALQHRQNQLNMSKAQRWAHAVKHKSTIINPYYPPPHFKLSNNVFSCDNAIDPLGGDAVCERVVCSSSKASDVPGPDTTLYLDPTVPFLPLRTNPQQTNGGGKNIPVNFKSAVYPCQEPDPDSRTWPADTTYVNMVSGGTGLIIWTSSSGANCSTNTFSFSLESNLRYLDDGSGFGDYSEGQTTLQNKTLEWMDNALSQSIAYGGILSPTELDRQYCT